MPHIKLKMYPGVTEDQKKEQAMALTEQVMKFTGKPEMAISVDIVEVPEENWMREVYDMEIKPNMDKLYKKPGYSVGFKEYCQSPQMNKPELLDKLRLLICGL